jgi:putative MATE family efflux protein
MTSLDMAAEWRRVLRLGWPISLQALAASSFALLDVAMVQSLGPDALAAVGLAGRTLFFVTMILMGLCSGAAVLLAQHAGQGDFRSGGGILRLLIVIVLALTVGPALLLQFNAAWVGAAFGLHGRVAVELDAFLHGMAWALPLIGVIATLATVCRNYGDSRMPLVASVAALLLNAVLNALLIFGLAGLPAMGVAGAALATTLSKAFELVLLLQLMRSRTALWQGLVRGLRARHWQVPDFTRLALPFMVQEASFAGGLLAFGLVFAAIGTDALALAGLIAPLEGVLINLFIGGSVACGIVAGQMLGQGRFADADALARHVLRRLVSLALPVCALGGAIAALVVLQLPWLQGRAAEAITMVALASLLVVIRVAAATLVLGVLRAGGDRHGVLWIDLGATWPIGLPIAALLALRFDATLPLVYAWLLAFEAIKLALLWRRMQQGHWLRRWVEEPVGAAAPMGLARPDPA